VDALRLSTYTLKSGIAGKEQMYRLQRIRREQSVPVANDRGQLHYVTRQ